MAKDRPTKNSVPWGGYPVPWSVKNCKEYVCPVDPVMPGEFLHRFHLAVMEWYYKASSPTLKALVRHTIAEELGVKFEFYPPQWITGKHRKLQRCVIEAKPKDYATYEWRFFCRIFSYAQRTVETNGLNARVGRTIMMLTAIALGVPHYHRIHTKTQALPGAPDLIDKAKVISNAIDPILNAPPARIEPSDIDPNSIL